MGHRNFLLIGLLALSACTPAARAVVGEGVVRIEQGEDAKARLAIKAPCAVTIGAYNRAVSGEEQRAVMALCGGSAERPVTVEDLQRFLRSHE